jgi:HK97 family phage major capsid protein
MDENIVKINERLSQISEELNNTADIEKLNALEKEVDVLKERRNTYVEERRAKALRAFESGTPVNMEDNEVKEIRDLSKRQKICYAIGQYARGIDISEVKKRALGVALTTTDTQFVAAAADVDGINNGGLFIQTQTLLDFLKETEHPSPILADINMSAIPNLIQFLYKKNRDEAKVHLEGVAGLDNQYEWAMIQSARGTLQTIIVVTDEIRALSAVDFGSYILTQILKDINTDWVKELIYADGTNGRVQGLITGAIEAVEGGYDAGDELDAIEAGLLKLGDEYDANAVIYVAGNIFKNIIFKYDDVGRPLHQLFNNGSVINKFANWRFEVEKNLKPGDFIIGNISEYFKVNLLEPLKIETDRDIRRKVTTYAASEMCATAVLPGTIVYGKLKV